MRVKLSTVLYAVATIAFVATALALGAEFPLVAIGLACVAGGLFSAALGY